MEPVKFSIVSKGKPTNKRSAPDKKQDGVDYVTSISGSVIVRYILAPTFYYNIFTYL
jgi:hypothetical protein